MQARFYNVTDVDVAKTRYVLCVYSSRQITLSQSSWEATQQLQDRLITLEREVFLLYFVLCITICACVIVVFVCQVIALFLLGKVLPLFLTQIKLHL